MVRHLRREGVRIGRRRAGRLMRRLGLQAIDRALRLSAPHPAHRVSPSLLQGLTIERATLGLVRRHHLHPSALRVPVPRSDHGLGEPACAGLAAVEHPRRGLLRRSPRRRAGPPWPAGDLQHRPGQPVHERRLHRALAGRRHPDLDGRPGPVPWTTSVSSGCGVRANTRPSICMNSPTASRLGASSASGSAATRPSGPHSARGGRTPAEAYRGARPVDMIGHVAPTRAQGTRRHDQQPEYTLTHSAANLSDKPGPPQCTSPDPRGPALVGNTLGPRRADTIETCGVVDGEMVGAR